MFISSWIPWRLARQHKGPTRPSHAQTVRRRGIRIVCEQLEDRTVPSSFTAATVDELIADINLANSFDGLNTITLTAPTTSPYTLTAADNTTDGSNGLPVIAAGNNLTIQGNGDTIDAAGFGRLFDVALGASLTLANVTLQHGANMHGGAILNQGALTLHTVTVTANQAIGVGASGAGGGIYSSGSLTLEAGTVIGGNGAVGGYGAIGGYFGSGGFPGFGGGLYVAGGTATLTNVTLSSNSARGGDGYYDPNLDLGAGPVGGYTDPGGSAFGGGLYVAGGTVTLTSSTLSSNSAQGGAGYGFGSFGGGGGLYVASGTVTLTNATLSSNSAQGGHVRVLPFYSGGDGYGGGLYVAGGTVTLTSSTLSSNSAQGGAGYGDYYAYGGRGDGGGVYVAGGTVTLRYDTVTGNSAQGGPGSARAHKQDGGAAGGGLYISPVAAVYLDAFTLKHAKTNKPDQIYGSYTLIT